MSDTELREKDFVEVLDYLEKYLDL